MAQPAAATGGVANVIIIGTTGSGKSTLGNLLLFGEDAPEHGFAVGDGRNAETSGLKSLTGPESGACALQVIDTPGIPDTDRKKSLGHYDEIIEHVRTAPWINAIIIMVAEGRIHEQEYKEFRALMKEFNTLPCGKLMVFRSTLPPNCTDERRKKKDTEAMQSMGELCNVAGMPFTIKSILHDMNGDEVQSLRNLLCQMPRTRLGGLQLRTFSEIKAVVQNLSDKNSRMEALGTELERLSAQKAENAAVAEELQRRLQKQESIEEGAKNVVGVFFEPLEYFVDLFSRLPGLQAAKQTADSRVDEISTEMERKQAELKEGRVDLDELEKAKKELDELQILG